MDNFQHIKKHLIDNLNRISYENGDLSDIGNEIGIVLGHYVETEQDFKDLVQGMRHGISLTNGTH